MPIITFKPGGARAEVPEGTLLLDAARKAGVAVEAPCGGNGVCGKCLAKIETGEVDFPDGLLPRDIAEEGFVLTCRAKASGGDVTLHVLTTPEKEQGKFSEVSEDIHLTDKALLPALSDYLPLARKTAFTVPAPEMGDGLSDYDRFLKSFIETAGFDEAETPLWVLQKLPRVLRENGGKVYAVFAADGGRARIADVFTEDVAMLGAAVDIGTTTVAVQLVDLETGAILSSKTDYNAQISCGLDVISRINYAKKPERLSELKDKVLETINGLLREAAKEHGAEPGGIINLSLAANTTMVQLLLGIPPENLRLSPYTPGVYDVPLLRAGEIGICVNPGTLVYIAPSVGSYVGGDITSGLLCTHMPSDEEGLSMFLDLGTNGELVIGNAEFMMGCACSAGPAFEGGGIENGMRASAGAVERVAVDPETGVAEVFVIDSVPPKGICGSGIISLIAELFTKGFLDARGKLDRSGKCARIDANEKNARYIIVPPEEGADGKPVAITEADIDNFIRAKGAIFSACRTMLGQIGMDFDALTHVYVAGGFGRYLDIGNAKTLGLLPGLEDDKFLFLGNSSVVGAYMTLLSEKHRQKEKDIAGKITYIDLSTEPDYMNEYTAALFLPHTDASLFAKKT